MDRYKDSEREGGMLGVSLQGNKTNCCCNILIKGRRMC